MQRLRSSYDNWVQDRNFMFISAGVGLALTYAMATRAIDTGSLGQYGLTFLFLAMSIKLIRRAQHIKDHGKGKR